MYGSHRSHLKPVPSMVERPGLDGNQKTTPLHMEVFEEGSKHSGDGRDSLTEDNIDS